MSITASSAPLPRLAPPGAGIPAIERWVGAIRLSLARRASPGSTTARFERERRAIRQSIAPLADHARATRVLIARPRGLEDSSRFWSAWMTLDHLRIVNAEIARVIAELRRDRDPAGEASTAAVKPSETVGAEVLDAHEQACDALIAAASGAADLRTRRRFSHPWFGPLDAAGWHAMAAMHMGLHRKQLERIVAGLPRG